MTWLKTYSSKFEISAALRVPDQGLFVAESSDVSRILNSEKEMSLSLQEVSVTIRQFGNELFYLTHGVNNGTPSCFLYKTDFQLRKNQKVVELDSSTINFNISGQTIFGWNNLFARRYDLDTGESVPLNSTVDKSLRPRSHLIDHNGRPILQSSLLSRLPSNLQDSQIWLIEPSQRKEKVGTRVLLKKGKEFWFLKLTGNASEVTPIDCLNAENLQPVSLIWDSDRDGICFKEVAKPFSAITILSLKKGRWLKSSLSGPKNINNTPKGEGKLIATQIDVVNGICHVLESDFID